MELVLLLLAVTAILLITVVISRTRESPHRAKLFPGPQGVPLLGDLLTTPVYGAVYHFKLLTDKFGPIAETNLLGQRFLLISSGRAVDELLVSHGKTVSGRPNTFAVKDAQSNHGTAEYLPLMSFNEDHHRHKRVGKVYMGAIKSRGHLGYPTIEAQRLMRNLVKGGEAPQRSWIRMTEDLTSRVISRIVFGTPQHAVRLHDETWQLLVWVSPNGVLPNLLNFLDTLPRWLSPWKHMEFTRHQRQQGWFESIMNDVEYQMKMDTAPPSLMRDYLAQEYGEMTYATRSDACKALGMLATAAIFTISGPMQNIVRAYACFPEWQEKLQAEIDTVAPFPQLPDLSDLPNLPMLRAFLRETTRWRQAIPSGIPHEVEEDTIFRGVVLPKGTGVFPLEYGINRDPEVYDHPYDFNPMRWLDPKSPNYQEPLSRFPSIANTPMFGWGRRYCLGHELAMDELHIFAIYLVWSFNVKLTDRSAVEKNLLPGEKAGGPQWPTAREQALIIMRPEEIDLEFSAREGRTHVIASFGE